ncbi:MAG: hypothetical protein ACPGR2_16660 [Psychrobium sp.]
MSIKENEFLALIKFFREIDHLEMFLDGKIYCNTPEYYRLSNAPGVSDKNESCHFSIRSSRGESHFEVEMNNNFIGKVSDFTIRTGRRDGWLHCWAILRTPETDIDFEKMQSDFKRMQREFGPHFVFVTAENSHVMAERIASATNNEVDCHEIDYKEHTILGSSIKTKHVDFSYQREFRFIFEECSDQETEPKIYNVENGFRDIAQVSPKFELVASTETEKYQFTLENKN